LTSAAFAMTLRLGFSLKPFGKPHPPPVDRRQVLH
jgi:hypothetical protein